MYKTSLKAMLSLLLSQGLPIEIHSLPLENSIFYTCYTTPDIVTWC